MYVPESTVFVVGFLVTVLAAASEGLGSAVIVVLPSLGWLDQFSLEIAEHFQCTLEMLSVWIYDHKAGDKMAFLCLCPLGSPGQQAVRDGLG